MSRNVLKYFNRRCVPVYLKSSKPYSTKTTSILPLKERGMFEDIFPGNAATEVNNLLTSSSQCVYAGFDPTADSLHVGNLLVLINLLHWQKCGHQAVALIGGATGHIGDPSGRSSERPYLISEQVFKNADGIKQNITNIFENFLKYVSKDTPGPPVKIVNNYDWYLKMNAVEFVAYVGRHFRMGTMLRRESVAQRVSSEHGLSFTEFTYQIFQAYDWLHLLRKYNCKFQIGGSDQMGNIVSGHDLINRIENTAVYGITLPLIKSESGDKFGKSAGNAVWLSASKTSPYDFYQFFLRTKDADVENLLKLLTFDSLTFIKGLMQEHLKNPSKWSAQKHLAERLTLLVHGEEGLRLAELTSNILHGSDPKVLSNLSTDEASKVFCSSCSSLVLKEGQSCADVAVEAGCFQSERDARRIIAAGGFSINYQKVLNPDEFFSPSIHVLPNRLSFLRVGKKNFFVVRWKS